MTRYFMRDTPLCQMEQQMMTPPYFKPMPTGWIWSGISRSSVSRRRWTKAAAMRYPAGAASPMLRLRRGL